MYLVVYKCATAEIFLDATLCVVVADSSSMDPEFNYKRFRRSEALSGHRLLQCYRGYFVLPGFLAKFTKRDISV